MGKISSKDISAEYGSRFGNYLIRIGKENFDMDYNKDKKEGTRPFMPMNPIPKFFVRRTFVSSMKFVDDPITPNLKLIMFNDDPKLCVPSTEPLRAATSEEITKAIAEGDSKDLDSIFFKDEETVLGFVEAFNKNTINKVNAEARRLLECVEGLGAINRSERETFKANNNVD